MHHTPTNSSHPASPDRSSVASPEAGSDHTNATSPVLTPLSANCYANRPGPSPELGSPRFSLPRQPRLASTASQRLKDRAGRAKGESVLVPLSDSDQNSRASEKLRLASKGLAHSKAFPQPTDCENPLAGNDASSVQRSSSPANPCSRTSSPTDLPGKKRKRSSSPNTSMPISFIETKLLGGIDLTFKHEDCVGDGARCTDLKASYKTSFHFAGRSREPGVVYRQKRFEAQEATTGQIRFVISQSPCCWTKYFEEAWQNYIVETRRKGRKNRHTKESYLSKRFFEDINEVTKTFCPNDPDAVLLGSFAEPIYVDD